MDFKAQLTLRTINIFSQEYDMKDVLGCGAFGVVRLAIHKPTDCKVAVKVVNKMKISKKNPKYIELLKKEITTLQESHHPNIVKVLELCEDKDNFYCVMELITGGTLTELMNKRAMPETKVKYIINQMVKALKFLHTTKEITHRDLKPDNILIEAPDRGASGYDPDRIRVKLTDFGFATFFNKDTSTLNMGLGTARYMAPELLSGGVHGFKVDIWALGVITYLALAGTDIWQAKDQP